METTVKKIDFERKVVFCEKRMEGRLRNPMIS